MKHTTKRALALLLALAMGMSLLCSSAWSAQLETPEEADASVSSQLEEEDLAQETQEDTPEDSQETPEPQDQLLPQEEEESAQEEETSQAPEEPQEEPSSLPAPEEEAEEDEEEGEELCESGSAVNPLYQDLVSEEELEQALEELEAESDELETQAETVKLRTKVSQAGGDLRKMLKQRKKAAVVKLRTKNSSLYALAADIWKEAIRHTGKATEGDYLGGQFAYYNWTARYKYAKGKYTYTIKFKPKFFTSVNQEKKTDTAVKKILTSLNLSRDSKFVKLHKIYGWLCRNVHYDYAGAKDSKNLICHSAYAAAVKKKAVCQGYAELLYRMLLQSGVDCRVIFGYGDGEAHAWNIVKLGKRYYNLDSTWDAPRKSAGLFYQYFLRSDGTFYNHTRNTEYRTTSFYKSYPMSSTDGDYHYWESASQDPSCTQDGFQCLQCSDCGKQKNVTILPALGHNWVPYEDYPDTYRCSRCTAWVQSGVLYQSAADRAYVITNPVKLDYSSKEQSVKLKVETNGSGLSYTSDTDAVQVSSKGKLTVAPGFTGQALITVTAQGTDELKAGKGKVKVTVRPKKTALRSVKAAGKGKVKVCWKENATGQSFEVAYSTDRRFKKDSKSVTVEDSQAKCTTLKGLKSKKVYYVRVRSVSGKARSSWSKAKKVKTK